MSPPNSSSAVWRPSIIFPLAILLRLSLLFYGNWQDAHSPLKYTDVDYLVFTDATRAVARGGSPYDRATYRYTPLLAWMLLPTAAGGRVWFEFGKALFAASDILTGWMIWRVLRSKSPAMDDARALRFASIWLLNPMVAQISTRGSSEGLLAALVAGLLWAGLRRKVLLAGALLGFGVHFKIYPFIYTASLAWWLGGVEGWSGFLTKDRLKLAASSFVTFMSFNGIMYCIYGMPFLEHSYLYHVARIDHRHNFSIYNTVLHLSSVQGAQSGLPIESLAFLPQLFLSVVAIPLALAKIDLASTMLAQTFAFVTFNKVCTSQYFLWYMVFLPFYLPSSSLLHQPRMGITALVLWIVGQALWLQQGYELEFLGHSTFVPGLWFASMVFFLVNCWILGIVVRDVKLRTGEAVVEQQQSSKR